VWIISGCTEKEHLRGLVWLPIKQICGVPWNYSGVIWDEKIAKCCDFLQSQFAVMRSKMKWLEFNMTCRTTDRVCHMYWIHCMYVTELKDVFTLTWPLICYVSAHSVSCSVYSVLIAATGTLRLPWLSFFLSCKANARE